MKTEDLGFDYGLGRVNIDHATGIRYGVIPLREVCQAWLEDSQPNYGEMECANCGESVTVDMPECPECGADFCNEFDYVEPQAFTFTGDGYQAVQGADDPDIFVTESPYFTYCQFCSPCAPGAGYVTEFMDPEKGIKAYCFGHEWFDDGVAPYPVYSVETGELVCPVCDKNCADCRYYNER